MTHRLHHLQNYRIILASQSPRRQELLKMLDLPFEILASTSFNEEIPVHLAPHQVPEELAKQKAAQVKLQPHDLLITADTVVLLDNKILGKPHTTEGAIEMLSQLQGRIHTVVTGVCITSQKRQESFSCHTQVHFAPLSQEQIVHYVKTYQPLDKAGAYGIQEWIGAVAVSKIEGSFYNVMGLPLHQLYLHLAQWE